MEESMRQLNEIFRMTEKLADIAGNIILQLIQKQDYVETSGIKSILEHVSEGKGTITATVGIEHAQLLANLIKEAHIPFVEIEHTNPQNKENKTIFVMRDKDKSMFTNVQKKFRLELDQAGKELDLDTFLEHMEGKPFATVNGLSREELYAFREAAKNYDLKYAVIAEQERYTVLGSDYQMTYHTVSDLSYNLSGKHGKIYKTALEEYLSLQERFKEAIEIKDHEEKYIVDAKNPRNFIHLSAVGFTTHSIGSTEQKQLDGTTKKVFSDVRHTSYSNQEKGKIVQLAESMGKPVILSKSAFPLVDGISKTGEAVLNPKFIEHFESFQEDVKKRKPLLKRVPKIKKEYTKEKLSGYVGLPQEVIQAIAGAGLEDVYTDGHDVGYKKEMEPAVQAVMEAYLYLDMPILEKLQAEIHYRGQGEISLIHPPDQNQYLINPDVPGYVVAIEPDKIEILRDGKITKSIGREEKGYEQTITNVITSIKRPIVLSKEEMDSEQKAEIITSRLPENIENKAIAFMNGLERLEQNMLHGLSGEIPVEDLSPRQQEAFRYRTRFNVEQKTMGQLQMEQIRELEIDKKERKEEKQKNRDISGVDR